MFTRMTGLFIVPIWMAAMSWLGYHEIWPTLTAREPPRLLPADWQAQDGRKTQYAVYRNGERIGAIWTRIVAGEDSLLVADMIWIDKLPMPFTPLRVTADTVFTMEGLLDEQTIVLENHDGRWTLHGERFHAHFAFTFQSGPLDRAFKIPLSDGGLISDAFQPFGQLGRLHPGQSWKMQVYNPFADLLGIGDRFVSVVVRVTGAESIMTVEGRKHCLIVESPASTAWVNGHGEVLAQESILPVVGRIRITREADFDEPLERRRRRQELAPRRGARHD